MERSKIEEIAAKAFKEEILRGIDLSPSAAIRRHTLAEARAAICEKVAATAGIAVNLTFAEGKVMMTLALPLDAVELG